MWLQKMLLSAVILFLSNIPLLAAEQIISGIPMIAGIAIGIICFLAFQIFAGSKAHLSIHIKVLTGGYLLLWSAAFVIVAELVFIIAAFSLTRMIHISLPSLLLSAGIMLILVGMNVFNGSLRVMFSSKQMKIIWKLFILFTMWVPVWNIVLVIKVCKTVRREYMLEADLQEADLCRKELEICHTKYPIVMVHGIFFRDWQYMNYWGRIPFELQKNGAQVFYGKQQSALPVAESALEVKENILEAIQASGAEKVNIIAHSKGGLDARYAISRLGMDEYAASLTTINTPHKGCIWAENLLKKLPEGLVLFTAKKYNRLFQLLGDKQPDFFNAVKDLTATKCEELNKIMPDMPGVYYQSITSVMKGYKSAAFPLNLLYPIVRKAEGENDGLVSAGSAQWGNFLGVLSCKGKRGISHADMIDLMRENIPDFHVREFYVGLVKDLKEQGF